MSFYAEIRRVLTLPLGKTQRLNFRYSAFKNQKFSFHTELSLNFIFFKLVFKNRSTVKILIIEDEKELSQSIATYLKAENYLCEIAADLKTGMHIVESFDYDCVLLDISLPDGNGLKILEELKTENKVDGVIIISARNSIDDRIKGLNLGADDYLSKPFHLSELSARVAAVIRRRNFSGQKNIVIKEVTVDLGAKTILINNKPVDFTRKEYDLMLYLISNKNRVVSKNAIAEHIAGEEADFYNNYDVIYSHIKNLKRKVVAAGGEDYIKSIYGMGYKYEVH